MSAQVVQPVKASLADVTLEGLLFQVALGMALERILGLKGHGALVTGVVLPVTVLVQDVGVECPLGVEG